jgi:hypothetical protein
VNRQSDAVADDFDRALGGATCVEYKHAVRSAGTPTEPSREHVFRVKVTMLVVPPPNEV